MEAAEFAHRQQAHRRTIGQALQAGSEGGQGFGQLGEHAAVAAGLVAVGVVAALGELEHGRAGAAADQAQGQGHLLAERPAGHRQARGQGRQLTAQALQFALAGQLQLEHLAQHRVGSRLLGFQRSRQPAAQLGGGKLQGQHLAALQGRGACRTQGHQRPGGTALIEGGGDPARAFSRRRAGGPLVGRLEVAAVGAGPAHTEGKGQALALPGGSRGERAGCRARPAARGRASSRARLGRASR